MEGNRNNQTVVPAAHDLSQPLPELILASSSPRRIEILRTVGWPFEAQAADIDESCLEGEGPVSYVERLAREKAGAVLANRSGSMVIGADTVVVVDEEILGKPRDEDDACRMLKLLNDRWHEVVTGVALCKGPEVRVAHAITEVRFGFMTDSEIKWYVARGEPMDKAGAYAIQGLGARFIEGIKGEYFNVVGLPVRLLYRLCQEANRAATV